MGGPSSHPPGSRKEVVLFLTVDNAAQWLSERDLLSPADIVDGRLLIADAGRRNRNFRVTRRDRPGTGYLIKQAAESGADNVQTIAAEAAFYRFCKHDPRGAPLRVFVPRFICYAESSSTLVIELLENAIPIWAFLVSDAAADVRMAAARTLGDALGRLHSHLRIDGDSAPLPLPLSPEAPWILWVHRPRPTVLERISAANLQTLKILQASACVTSSLDALRESWAASTVVHNDIKSDNVLVWQADDGRCELRIVDWELVQAGDPAWDIGGVFSDLWVHWVGSIPFGTTETPAQALAQARHQLSAFFPAMRAFWSGYCHQALTERESWTPFLERAICGAAARLIQTAYEQAQDAPVLPNSSVAMLQIASNVFEDYETAQLHLLGIPPSLTLMALQR